MTAQSSEFDKKNPLPSVTSGLKMLGAATGSAALNNATCFRCLSLFQNPITRLRGSPGSPMRRALWRKMEVMDKSGIYERAVLGMDPLIPDELPWEER